MSNRSSNVLWALALGVSVASCASGPGGPLDSGARFDAAPPDAAQLEDAGSSPDAAPPDAAPPSDASPTDAQTEAVCVLDETQPCFIGDPALAGVGACARGAQLCDTTAEFASWGACEGSGAPSTELCNSVDDDCDGSVDEDAGAASETCGNSIDDDCDGSVDEDCGGPCEPIALAWGISAEEMRTGASDSTGAGECFGTVYFSGSTGSTTPPGGCGVPHCGTLRYGDGRTRAQYCTVRATCSDGAAISTGFGW